MSRGSSKADSLLDVSVEQHGKVTGSLSNSTSTKQRGPYTAAGTSFTMSGYMSTSITGNRMEL